MSKILFYRGDSLPITITLWSNPNSADVFSIDGFTFEMTVNTNRDPIDNTNKQFAVVGNVTNSSTGTVVFTPTSSQTDIPAGEYWYDISMYNESESRTLRKDVFIVQQDITKA